MHQLSPISRLILIAAAVQVTQVTLTSAANILGIITLASVSHHLPFRPLWRELSNRGHKVTVITTDPIKNTSNYNLREIDISHVYKIYEKYEILNVISDETMTYSQLASVIQKLLLESHDYIFRNEEVQDLIHNPKHHFDVVLAEAHTPLLLPFGYVFKCPLIGIASLDPAMQFHDSMGNLVHPVINPDPNLGVEDSESLSFSERVQSFLYTYGYKYVINHIMTPSHHEFAKKYFGEGLPELRELQDNVSLMFTSTHPLFHNVRAVNLNTVAIGAGMHLQEPKELPTDIQKFLDDSPNGVIYFSLGSNIKSNILTENFKKAILETFAEIPYRVLLKMDCDFRNVSSNVFIRKWMPQQDILRHPNIKLFITQGGLQSLQESISNGVPLIGIPFFGDQISNVNKMVKRGYGIKVDRKSVTKHVLVKAIKEVIHNSKYRDMAKEMGNILKDEEIPGVQRAVYWTEYVIRHKGAKHLRSPATGMPAWKYYMLDVLSFFALIAFLIIFTTFVLLRLIVTVTVNFSKKSVLSRLKIIEDINKKEKKKVE